MNKNPSKKPPATVTSGRTVTNWTTGSAPKRRSQTRKLEPPPDLRTHLQTENKACPGPDPGLFAHVDLPLTFVDIAL
jgi:hypothetical protein